MKQFKFLNILFFNCKEIVPLLIKKKNDSTENALNFFYYIYITFIVILLKLLNNKNNIEFK